MDVIMSSLVEKGWIWKNIEFLPGPEYKMSQNLCSIVPIATADVNKVYI